MYDVAKYNTPHMHTFCACDEAPYTLGTGEAVLYTTSTCPNCKMVKMMLDKAKLPYTVVVAEENKELFIANGIKQAPTLIAPDGVRYENASNIKKYIEEHQ